MKSAEGNFGSLAQRTFAIIGRLPVRLAAAVVVFDEACQSGRRLIDYLQEFLHEQRSRCTKRGSF
ncbi:MAG: hypothetical protein NFW16_13610, partial [Candidatus Accumulibacter sp.]|uniref:hypothetical protein n=1 Tax=Accumulibacter sp. TaxID=2053492 RepID=UPI002583B472